jgi:ADP-heptose:LPS heptosyltransferase
VPLLSHLYNLAVLGRWRDDPGPFDPAQVKRILVVRNDNIGDVVCTTPALDALRAAFPHAFLAALVCSLTAEVLAGHRALDALYVYPKAKHRHHGWLESHRRLLVTLARIRRQRFDLAVCFRASFSTSQAWLAYASGARWRLGPRAEGHKARWGFFYNLPAPPAPPGTHEVLRCFHLLRQIQVDSPDKRLYLKVPARARRRAREFWREHGLGEGEVAPVILNLTRWAYRPDRSWPAGHYRELARRLARRSGGVVITHAPADRPWVEQTLTGLSPRPPVFWSRSLKEFCAVIARARAFVTAEGGPMHLAAAVGTPLVVLWSRTSLAEWRPWGVPCHVLEGGDDLGRITPAQAEEALESLLADTSAQGRREARA